MIAVLLLNKLCHVHLHSTEDCDCSTTVIAVSVTLVAVIIAIIIINVVVAVYWKFIRRRKSGLRVDPTQEGGTVQDNPAFQNSVHDVTEGKSSTPVSSESGEEGPEQRGTVAKINQNDASIHQSLSTQSTSSTTSTKKRVLQ